MKIARRVATKFKKSRLETMLVEYEYEPSYINYAIVREIAGLLSDVKIITYNEYQTIISELMAGAINGLRNGKKET